MSSKKCKEPGCTKFAFTNDQCKAHANPNSAEELRKVSAYSGGMRQAILNKKSQLKQAHTQDDRGSSLDSRALLGRSESARVAHYAQRKELSMDCGTLPVVYPIPKRLTGHAVWHLPGLVPPSLCESLIYAAEDTGWRSVGWEYDPNYRSCERVVASCPAFASALWVSLQHSFTPASLMDLRPFGFGNQGTWVPVSINECFRFSKYKEGGQFEPHRDGGFVRSDEERSVLTLLIYLSSVPNEVGGSTVFFTDKYPPSARFTPSSSSSSAFSSSFASPCVAGPRAFDFQPVVGDAILFTHDTWHSAMPLVKGKSMKFIARTDVMFRRVDSTSWPRMQSLSDPVSYVEAEKFYQKSIQLQEEGKPGQSTEAYVTALSIQARYPSCPPNFVPLGVASYVDRILPVLLFTLPLDEVAALGRVCRTWRRLVGGSSCWLKLLEIGTHHPIRAAPLASLPLLLPMTLARESVKLAHAIAVDFGSMYTKTACYSPADRAQWEGDPSQYEHIKYHARNIGTPNSFIHQLMKDQDRFSELQDPSVFPSIVVPISGHNWSTGEAFDRALIGNQVLRACKQLPALGSECRHPAAAPKTLYLGTSEPIPLSEEGKDEEERDQNMLYSDGYYNCHHPSFIPTYLLGYCGECLYHTKVRAEYPLKRSKECREEWQKIRPNEWDALKNENVSRVSIPQAECARFIVPLPPLSLPQASNLAKYVLVDLPAGRLSWCRGISLVSGAAAACAAAQLSNQMVVVVNIGARNTYIVPVHNLMELSHLAKASADVIYSEPPFDPSLSTLAYCIYIRSEWWTKQAEALLHLSSEIESVITALRADEKEDYEDTDIVVLVVGGGAYLAGPMLQKTLVAKVVVPSRPLTAVARGCLMLPPSPVYPLETIPSVLRSQGLL